jgi:hypothetical protein
VDQVDGTHEWDDYLRGNGENLGCVPKRWRAYLLAAPVCYHDIKQRIPGRQLHHMALLQGGRLTGSDVTHVIRHILSAKQYFSVLCIAYGLGCCTDHTNHNKAHSYQMRLKAMSDAHVLVDIVWC